MVRLGYKQYNVYLYLIDIIEDDCTVILQIFNNNIICVDSLNI